LPWLGRGGPGALGFATVRDFGSDEINARFFDHAGARLRVGGFGRVVLARI
jgi:hypothetical protein